MEKFLKEKDPIVDSVDLKYNKNQVDHAHISYFDMVQPEPYAVKRNLISYKKKHKISSTTDRVVWFDEEGIGMQLSCWWYRVVCCNSPLRKVSRHLSFRALLPYQRCWGEALWPWSHAEASMIWKRWFPLNMAIFGIYVNLWGVILNQQIRQLTSQPYMICMIHPKYKYQI